MDVVRQIRAFNAGRESERLQIKYRTMRASPFAFLRATCHLFYDRLPPGGVFKSAPLVWVCGDLHLENFGSYKGDNRLVYFDINDCDEAALAPASWDLVRMLTSLWVGAESIALSRSEARRLCEIFLEAYSSSLVIGKAYWVERDMAQGLVRGLLDGLRNRERPQFLEARTHTKGKKRILRVDGDKALPASAAQREVVMKCMATFAQSQTDPNFYKVLDVARRIAGTGSLGLDRYVVLIRGQGSPDRNYLLDLKASLPSTLAPHLKAAQPRWKTEAHRVASMQRRIQAVSAAFLEPVLVGESAYVLRDLQPSEDRIKLDRSSQTVGELQHLIGTMGRMVAWAQLRSSGRGGSATADELIDFGQRKKWKEKLLSASVDCAAQLRKDSAVFDAAYDDEVFNA